MLSCDKGEGDLFYDSADCFDSGCDQLEFDVWLTEPQSVKERRQGFLRGMGLDEAASKRQENTGLERITECFGAVSCSSVPCKNVEEVNMVSCNAGREENSEANCMVDELSKDQMDKPEVVSENEIIGPSLDLQGREQFEEEKCKKCESGKIKMKSWWKLLLKKRKEERVGRCVSGVSKLDTEAPKTNRTKVKQNKKGCMEFTGVYMGQEIQAHKGFIWTMKFSPDGQYLATGGEDRIIRVWRVTLVDSTCKSFPSEGHCDSNLKEAKSNNLSAKKTMYSSVVIPEKVFQIEETPLQEFRGHASEILDLAWSNSNHLLSSSMDKTVRLWRLGCNRSLNIFRHSNYVTCIQFNPVDKNYFISGSIDGKVRIWGVSEKRVVHWTDVRDVISAISYQPEGRGFVVGTIEGTCRFYEVSGTDLQLEAVVHIQGRKRTSGNRITGIQFSQEICPRVMVTSEDSKVRVFDGVDIVNKFKGLSKSGSQMSASFTSNGRHIISVGEDCRVYVWNYDGLCTPWSKHKKSVKSCEHFFSEGVSVAVPWSGTGTEVRGLGSRRSFQTEEAASWRKDSDRFSLGSWFFMDGRCRGSYATWPEEKLPMWDVPVSDAEYENQIIKNHQQQQQRMNTNDHISLSEAWGLVIVTAGWDGKIRAFHNYGLPIVLK
ncbi:TRANSDUCIN/WD40 REPEAT-LIKE SUPERFAMILY PROTEIN [Salix viminalis]|uniref:TRANSDUCIN/WD40 REPEAT-LIKE SUPERFAMILY PROTEIN n=1 Tax=Salix viminalis TaxID=40686 RepID=A0A9Q0ZK17_SALVM|nr:TRANSDUCIN/WD40 REPEAT-LIKE SUPERFAMILY PROTEIN [Salix viminalis]KAJ6737366.1 TRANSDUCIN/WD40 REPEAT-LIKE SUPERFAMILY PROTEIN [Salix viminalis]